MQNFPNLTKPFLDPIFDVEPVFEVRFDSKSRLEGVLVKTLRTFQATPVHTHTHSPLAGDLLPPRRLRAR